MAESKADKAIKSFYAIEKKGKAYQVIPMSLQYAQEYTSEPAQFVLPDGNDYRRVLLNFSKLQNADGEEIDMAELMKKWIPRIIRYGNEPCTLQKLIEDGWDIVDFGELLKKSLAVSG